jgi:hypothetical protein
MAKFATFDAQEQVHVEKIIDRAMSIQVYKEYLAGYMDLSAVHAACPLDLEKLAGFDDFNFAHDVGGIHRHLSRSTGKLQNFFVPRSAKPVTQAEN